MARIQRTEIRNYRSIGDAIEIAWPANVPVVLLGQNNAGKSNIVRACELVLGGVWPGTHDPDDHEFFNRDRANSIEIRVRFDPADQFGGRYTQIFWRYQEDAAEPVYFRGFPGPAGAGGAGGYIRNEDRSTCMCVVLQADRNLRFHLGYSSKWTYLSRLMHRFHSALNANDEVKGRLEQGFADIKAAFRDIPEFAAFVAGLQEQLADLVGSMTHKLEVDFEAYNPVNFFHALRLQASEGGAARTLDEMGTGEQQILAMAFAHAYAKAFHEGVVLIIEEPEAHLHPLAQQWLARKLKEMTADGLQTLITTHSPAFVDILGLEGLVVVRKSSGSTRVKQINRQQLRERCVEMGVPPARVTVENILPFYAASATREILEGFFAQLVVLVEGPTEALALPVYLERIGLSVAKEGIAVVPVHGKGSLGKWWRLFRAYEIPCFVIFDNDAEDDAGGGKRRDALTAIGVPAGEQGGFVGTDEWMVREHFSVFGADFETALEQALPGYAALEEEARQQGINTKPFIGRWVAERIALNEGTAGRERLNQLSVRLRAKLPAIPAAGAGEPA